MNNVVTVFQEEVTFINMMHVYVPLTVHLFYHTQIADFGMARDVSDDNYYVTAGGKIPLKWTSLEVTKLAI